MASYLSLVPSHWAGGFQCWGLENREAALRLVTGSSGEQAARANIDVSHLQLSHTPPEEVRRLKGKAIHVHLSDCDGLVHGDLPPGRGVVDFPPYLREIKDLGMDGAISVAA